MIQKRQEVQIDEAPPNAEVKDVPVGAKKAKSYDSLRRKLREEELMNIGSVNLMIDDIERMDAELVELRGA
ncbi:hypothetical protein [Burkholderia gladioli]|uniref:hypothetical protein n=1 Tax=Burkholderia gladioli TaxID=28095 RepID=UPI00163EFC1C|nr:hypothetical protein [Burkholderia gladioli]